MAEFKDIKISGMLAWLIWLSVHIFYFAGLQNRLLVLTRWTFSLATRGRSARLITGKQANVTDLSSRTRDTDDGYAG